MNESCCDHCGKAVDIFKESEKPVLYTVWERLPNNEIKPIVVCEDCEPLFEKITSYCAACRKAKEELYMVLRSLPTGEQEDIFVCEECRPLFNDHIKYLFTIFGGPTYTDENHPPAWKNPAPLSYEGNHPSYHELNYVRLHDPERYANVVKNFALDTTQLPLDDFPLVKDFQVILHNVRMTHRPEEKEPCYLIYTFSPSLGYLALLDYSSHIPQDLCQPDFIIPHGDFALPYTDLEQGWNLLLAENDKFVYILTGNWERHEGYTTWFKVEKSCYYSQWEEAIHLCRSVCQGAEAQGYSSPLAL